MKTKFALLLEKQEEEDSRTASSKRLAENMLACEFAEADGFSKEGNIADFFASEGDLHLPFIPVRTTDKFYMKKHTLSQRPYLHTHNFYELIFVINGTCRQNNEVAPILHAGQACLIPPGTAHKIEKCTAQDIILKAVIPPELFYRVCPEIPAGVKIFHRFPGMPLIRLFCESCEKTAYKEQSERALLTIILIDMLREDGIFLPLEEYLRENYKSASLTQFSRSLGYTPAHTSRLIRARTGKTFSQAADEYRINQACLLLAQGHTALFAGEETGFATPAGFHRCFCRIKGMTPSEYAKG